MNPLLFTIPVLAALFVFGRIWYLRRRARRYREEFLATITGYSIEHALRVESYEDMDAFLRKLKCPCGGRLESTGESSRSQARVVRTECVECEEECFLYFDLRDARH